MHIALKHESYQDYLNRVKKGQALNEKVSGQIKYVYPKEAKDVLNGNNSDNNQSKVTVVDTYQGDRPQQNNGQQTQATTQNNTQSQSTTLPKTGKEEVNSSLVTSIAAVLLAVGSLLTFKRFSKANK
ncbi:LPXTG cell wall anchor domain-containing protein [Staphylococcus aureus]|uniref:LPXTG cell wall anchor domain-containing protein n=1 Tax=Staphylococcus aureus TaxID=1280 RepID=UPI00190AE6CF|nr:LPXTG cell wall anchor domain-containing protein [Staphylococcus aureus]MBK4047700.1 LPXTG cell wall anchor domain-containing protein [Staphylococcus aureus]